METIYEIDTIKIEKQKAMRRYRTFRKIANIVRTIEIFVAILFVSISFTWTSRCFPAILNYSGVFLRRMSSILFSPHFVFVIGNAIIITLFVKSGDYSSENTDEIVEDVVVTPATEVAVAVVEEEAVVVEKVYRRSKSTSMVEVEEKRELRRSATVPRRKAEEKRRLRMCEEDELSNEEFNRKVEEFIEKQRKFLSDETKILVLT